MSYSKQLLIFIILTLICKNSLIYQSYIKILPTNNPINAISIFSSQNSTIKGTISYQQLHQYSPLKICINITGLKSYSSHGIHIHQYGDISQSCNKIGTHYNPLNRTHGGQNDNIRHNGDLGNIVADYNGNVNNCMYDYVASLFGGFTVLGRSIAIHINQDDLGMKGDKESLKNGNSGMKIACATIAVAQEFGYKENI